MAQFFWPGVTRDVKEYYASYPECQLAAPLGVRKAALVPLLVVVTPSKRVALDLVGPLTKSIAGFRYILVIMEHTTHFPEAIPLRNATAEPSQWSF